MDLNAIPDAPSERTSLDDEEILEAHPPNRVILDQLLYMDSRLKVIERIVRFHLGDPYKSASPTDPNIDIMLGGEAK